MSKEKKSDSRNKKLSDYVKESEQDKNKDLTSLRTKVTPKGNRKK